MINVKNYLTFKYMMFVTLEEFFFIQWKENGVGGHRQLYKGNKRDFI